MIINADDFGYSESVNRAIADCFEKKLINRTTVMVNMPYAEEAKRIAFEKGFEKSVGLHINLTEGKALSRECAKSELCDENGYFKGVFHIPFKSRLYLKPGIRRAVYAECEAQIKKFEEMGFTLKHADSHNYTHSYFSVYYVVRKLLKKYNFTSARISRNVSGERFSLPFAVYKEIFNFLIKNLRVNGKKIKTTKFFGSWQDFEEYKDKGKIGNDMEIMSHPDYKDGILTDNTLPNPHSFVTKKQLAENGLHLEDVSGEKVKIFVGFIHTHIGGAMTSLVNFLNELDTDKYDVDVMFYEKGEGRYAIKDEINILPQGKIHEKLNAANVLKKALSVRYLWAFLNDLYYKKVKHNKRKAVQIMSKQGCRYSRKIKKHYDVAIAYELNWPMNYIMRYVDADKKVIWHHIEYENSGMDFSCDKKAMDDADALVFVSEDCMKSFLEKRSRYKDKAYFLPNILSEEYVRKKSKEKAGLPFEDCGYLKFLTVARIKFEHKGFDRAVRVFARLKKDGLLQNVKWIIAGGGTDFEKLREMIKAENLEDVIYPVGMIENPLPYYKMCDVFLLPSYHEGKPMAVTESLILGTVPIVTNYTSAKEQIKSQFDGLIFENDEEALYEGLKRVLQKPDMLKEMKENILKNHYGNEKEISLFEKMLEEIM